MSKHHSNNTAALRAAADAAVAEWQTAASDAKAKDTAYEEYRGKNPLRSNRMTEPSSPTLLGHTLNHIPVIEALASAERAERLAVIALDAAEVAEGDETARARDPKQVLQDWTALDQKATELQAQLNEVGVARDKLYQAARAADAAVAGRRRANGLPWLSTLPMPTNRPYTAVLAAFIENGLPVPDRTPQITQLRATGRKIAADLEERRLEEEARAKALKDEKEDRARRDLAENRASELRAKNMLAEREREIKRRESLADNYLARSGGAS
jgi:hypothetical protein